MTLAMVKVEIFRFNEGKLMSNIRQNLGFSYFSAPEYLIRNRIETWFPILKDLGSTQLILEASYDRAIPEDVFQLAYENKQEVILHFKGELPLARRFNEVAVLLDAYARWGVKYIVLGDKPNSKASWDVSGWKNDNLVDHFLDRFIPLADYVEKLGLIPVFPPLQPGGDYWDTAFMEMAVRGLQRRQMDSVLQKMAVASYGYTFNRSLTWGTGGPERWPGAHPYATPEGQEDQLGFNNREWMQAVVERTCGVRPAVLVLDAGNPFAAPVLNDDGKSLEALQRIAGACLGDDESDLTEYPSLDASLIACTFDMDTLTDLLEGSLTVSSLRAIFKADEAEAEVADNKSPSGDKWIEHYLLLPAHATGVSDVVLNKVRPIIKRFSPTIGFSLEEAKIAKRVSVFPDPILFTDEKLNSLRSAGCAVEVLPHSGIEIATLLNGNV